MDVNAAPVAEVNIFNILSFFRGTNAILPGLFLGPAAASEAGALEAQGITHVLRVLNGPLHDVPSHVRIAWLL